MSNDTTSQGVLFEQIADRPAAVRFDQAHSSSDGGSLLLKALDERLGLSSALSGCLRDGRQASKVQHDLQVLLRQRLFGIACGHADGNDAAGLAEDPVHKMLVDRDPLSGRALASQPTLSRFENSVGPKELIRLAEALAETVIRRHRRRKRSVDLITLDFDPTHDPTHGQQQLSLFNWVYDTRCYLPLAGFVSFDACVVYFAIRPCCGLAATAILQRLCRGLSLSDGSVAGFHNRGRPDNDVLPGWPPGQIGVMPA